MKKIAIIGAGLAGVTLARYLQDTQQVTIIEKARGVGGRMNVRRIAGHSFDHGTQFFSAKTTAFKEFLRPLIKQDIVKSWNIRFSEFKKNEVIRQTIWSDDYPHYVAVPAMNNLVKYLAKNVDIKLNNCVKKIEKQEADWCLFDQEDKLIGKFDWVISTAPAQQSAELMPALFQHKKLLQQIKMSGCYSLMLGFDQPLIFDFDAALVKEADISWISVNNTKYGREDKQSLLIHSTNQWADKHLAAEQEFVLKYLLAETQKVTGKDINIASYQAVHRWCYANIAKQRNQPYFADAKHQLATLGDWCIEGRVEAAFLSARAMAKGFTKY